MVVCEAEPVARASSFPFEGPPALFTKESETDLRCSPSVTPIFSETQLTGSSHPEEKRGVDEHMVTSSLEQDCRYSDTSVTQKSSSGALLNGRCA